MNVLLMPVKTGVPFELADKTKKDFVQFNALWDTGATNSCITSNVVAALGLKPTRVVETHGVHGKKEANGYSISLVLPAGVIFNSLHVTEAILGTGVDVIIGMDVIQEGDFFVTNHGGVTQVHFQIPGQGIHHLAAEVQQQEEDQARKKAAAIKAMAATDQTPAKVKQSRNSPCACGSGQKYKRCCGRLVA